MRGRFALMLMGGILAVAVISGCGGDDESLTKAEFLKRANAICAAGEKKKSVGIEQAFAKLGKSKSSSRNDLRAVVSDVAIPPIREMTEELGDLSPPDGDEDEVSEIVANYETALEKTEASPDDVLDGKQNFFAEADKSAKSYGLTSCEQG